MEILTRKVGVHIVWLQQKLGSHFTIEKMHSTNMKLKHQAPIIEGHSTTQTGLNLIYVASKFVSTHSQILKI